MKNVNYQRELFEKKFYWLNHRHDPENDFRYASDLTQLAWEGWCAMADLQYKQHREASKKKK
jgi:hypothetical protein